MKSTSARCLLALVTLFTTFIAPAPPTLAMPGMGAHPDTTQGVIRPALPKNMPPLPKAPARTADLSKTRKVTKVWLVIHHRVFADFQDAVKADMNVPFQIGDTDYKATVIQYVPDFALDIESMKVYSRTDQPNNPAFRIAVEQKSAPVDTAWALLDMPPHFSRKSLLSFQVMRVEFESGKPLVAKTPAKPAAAKPAPAPTTPAPSTVPGGAGK